MTRPVAKTLAMATGQMSMVLSLRSGYRLMPAKLMNASPINPVMMNAMPKPRSGAGMLTKVFRDAAEIPAVAEVILPFRHYLRQRADDLARAWPASRHERLRRAAIAHALEFDTWRSLSAQGLTEAEAAEVMVGMVTGVRRRERTVRGSRVEREP